MFQLSDIVSKQICGMSCERGPGSCPERDGVHHFAITIEIERKIVGVHKIVKRLEIATELIFVFVLTEVYVEIFGFYPSYIDRGIVRIFDSKIRHTYSGDTLRFI